TAQFNIAPDAIPGTPNIIVSTPSGSTTTSLFSITASGAGGGGGGSGGSSSAPSSTKEYVYLNGRILAIETSSPSTQPPTPPQSLTAQALSPTTVELSYSPATAAPDKTIVAYQLKRAGTVIATVPATQLSYLDTAALPAYFVQLRR